MKNKGEKRGGGGMGFREIAGWGSERLRDGVRRDCGMGWSLLLRFLALPFTASKRRVETYFTCVDALVRTSMCRKLDIDSIDGGLNQSSVVIGEEGIHR